MEISAFDQQLAAIYRSESRQVLATLIRLLRGNFDLAEESLQDAFTVALARWPEDGIPANPRAWLVSTGRFGRCPHWPQWPHGNIFPFHKRTDSFWWSQGF